MRHSEISKVSRVARELEARVAVDVGVAVDVAREVPPRQSLRVKRNTQISIAVTPSDFVTRF